MPKCSKKSALSEAFKKLRDAIYAPPKCVEEEVKQLASGLRAPVQVSPLIKLARYVGLLCGMVYGFRNNLLYSMKENQFREIENERKRCRDIQLAKERERLNREQEQAINDWVRENSRKN